MAVHHAQAAPTLCASTIRIVPSGLITARTEVAVLTVALGYNLPFLAQISMKRSSIHGMRWRISVNTPSTAFIPIWEILSQVNTTNFSDCSWCLFIKYIFLLLENAFFFLTWSFAVFSISWWLCNFYLLESIWTSYFNRISLPYFANFGRGGAARNWDFTFKYTIKDSDGELSP